MLAICAKAFWPPKSPETTPNPKFSRKSGVALKSPRNSHWIHTKRHTKPHWIPLNFPEISRISPNSPKFHRIPEISAKSGEERNSRNQPAHVLYARTLAPWGTCKQMWAPGPLACFKPLHRCAVLFLNSFCPSQQLAWVERPNRWHGNSQLVLCKVAALWYSSLQILKLGVEVRRVTVNTPKAWLAARCLARKTNDLCGAPDTLSWALLVPKLTSLDQEVSQEHLISVGSLKRRSPPRSHQGNSLLILLKQNIPHPGKKTKERGAL